MQDPLLVQLKPLSKLLTIILSNVKDGIKRYTDIIYSRNGVNQMWILTNSKELLENLKSKTISKVSSIKTFNLSMLYTTIPHQQLKSRLSGLISFFICKNGSRKYKYIVVMYDTAYFVKDEIDSPNKYSETDIIRIVELLIDNIYVELGGHVYQQTVGIPMVLIVPHWFFSHEADFINIQTDRQTEYLFSKFHK